MSVRSIAEWVLLSIGMAAFFLTAAGILLGDVFERLHYLGPGATIGIVSIAAAVIVHHPWSVTAIKAILTAALVFWTSPVISHATARAARVRRSGSWKASPDEQVQIIEARK